MTQSTTTAFPQLAGHFFLSLTTYRKNGDPVATPVWFAQAGDTVYVMTMGVSGKAKRIRNTGKVRVAPCDRIGTLLGEAAEASARIVDAEERTVADAALSAKYGEQKKQFDSQLTNPADRVYIAITAA